MAEHKDIPAGQVHVPHQWEFNSTTQRELFATTDIKNLDRLALQRDDGSYWRLSGIQPTRWSPVGQLDAALRSIVGPDLIPYLAAPGLQTTVGMALGPVMSLDALGVRADGTDQTELIQKILDEATAKGVPVVASGRQFTHAGTLYLNRGQTIDGVGQATDFRYIGSGIAMTTKTPGVRNYGWVLSNFTLSTPSIGSADKGLYLDSMSSCMLTNVRAIGFNFNFDIYSPVSGYAVYNRLYNCYAQHKKGYRIWGTSSNANLLYGCRGNLCLDGSYEIQDSNDNTDICCQWESGGSAAPAIKVTARIAGISPNNRSFFARLEGNTGVGYSIGPNVSEFLIESPMFTGAQPATPVEDAGVRTLIRGVAGVAVGNKESSALPVTKGPAWRRTRTVATGTDGVPLQLFEDTNAGSGNPVVIQADVARATGVAFRSSLNGVPGVDILGNGDLIAPVVKSPSIVAGGGTPVTKILSASQSFSFPSVAAGGVASFDLPVPGVVTAGVPDVSIGHNNYNADLMYSGTVVAANTVRIRVRNLSAAAITPVAQTFRATVRYFT